MAKDEDVRPYDFDRIPQILAGMGGFLKTVLYGKASRSVNKEPLGSGSAGILALKMTG